MGADSCLTQRSRGSGETGSTDARWILGPRGTKGKVRECVHREAWPLPPGLPGGILGGKLSLLLSCGIGHTRCAVTEQSLTQERLDHGVSVVCKN